MLESTHENVPSVGPLAGEFDGMSYAERQRAQSMVLHKAGQLGVEASVEMSEDWQQYRECADNQSSYPLFPRDSDLQIDAKGRLREKGDKKAEREAAAQLLCGRCSVREQCRNYAIKNKISGFAGGMNERQRKLARSK